MASVVNPESPDEDAGGRPRAVRYRAFLSHNSADKPAVEELARRLEKDGISCFLDKWHLIPGDPWQPALEDALQQSSTCVVFCGPSGLGPWQNEEMRAAIARRVSDPTCAFRVVPVLLPGAQREQRSRLPTFLVSATWVEFRQSLDEADAYHRLKCGIRGEPPGQAPGGALFEGTCPYRGLHVFEADHARFFFGRDAEVDWMLERLASNIGTPQEDRFLGVVGASGSGKSSLVRAGLIPALREGGSRSGKQIVGSTDWPIVIFKPGTDSLKALADALWSEPLLRPLISDPLGFSDLLLTDPRRLHATIGTALASLPEQRRLAIVVDQFEELFTQSSAGVEPQRQAFIDNLLYASTVRGGRTFVIITMRADFYGKCSQYEQLAHALCDRQELVPPLSEEGLRAAIEHPAQLCGLELEPGLVDLLVQDMRKQPAGALPLLQQTLYMLWERRDGRRLTVHAYREIGEIEGALESHADRVYGQELASDDDREICRRVLLMLTTPGEGTEDTRRRVPRPYLGNSTALEAVLDTLVRARLVTISETDPPQVEVTHEALIRGWAKLRSWIDADRESLRTYQQLITAAEQWEKHDHDPAYLYTGSRLVQAEEWRSLNEQLVTDFPLAVAFIDDAVNRRDAEERRLEAEQQKELQRSRRINVAAVLVSIVLAALSFWGYLAQSEANTALKELGVRSTEATAVAIMAGLRGEGNSPTQDEYESLSLLADSRPAVRAAFIEHLLTSPGKAKRLRSRYSYILHAVVGLNRQDKQLLQRLLLDHGQDPATKSMAINIACAELGSLLKVDTADFNLMVATNYVASIEKATDLNQLNALASELDRFGKRLPSTQTMILAQQIVNTMKTSTGLEHLYFLGTALGTLGENLTDEQAGSLAQQIAAALEKTTDTFQWMAFGIALGNLGEKLPSEQAAALANQIVAVIKANPYPMFRLPYVRRWEDEPLTHYPFATLGNSLGSLGKNLPPKQTAALSQQIVAAMKETTITDKLSDLYSALSSFDKKLTGEQTAVIVDQIVNAIEEIIDRIQAEPAVSDEGRIDYRYQLSYLIRALGSLGGKLPDEQFAAGTHQILAAIEGTYYSDRLLSALGSALGTLGEKLTAEQTATFAQQLVAAMEKTPDAGQSSALASALSSVGENLPAEHATAGARQMVGAMEKTTDPVQLSIHCSILAKLNERLSAEQAEALAQQILAAMKGSTDSDQLSSFGSALSSVGAKLTDKQAEALAQQILTAMKGTTDSDQLSSFGSALGSVGAKLPDKQAGALAQQIVAAMEETNRPNQLPVLYSPLPALCGALGSLSEKLPAEQAAAVAQRILTAMEASIFNNELSALGSALGSLSEKLPADQAVAGARKIVAAMEITTDQHELSALSIAVASLGAKLPIEQAEASAQQLVIAMEKTNDLYFQDQSSALGSALGDLAVLMELPATLAALKSLVCVGDTQEKVLAGLGKKTGENFDGNVWKAVQWAESQGIDLQNIPRWPVRRRE